MFTPGRNQPPGVEWDQAMQARVDETFSVRQADARADGAEREVSIGRRDIVIARRYRGVGMRINVKVRSFNGVVLSLRPAAAGRDCYRVSLWHRDPDLGIILYEAGDDRDIVARWKDWARFLDLPSFIERAPGIFENAETRLGDVAIGSAPSPRRRGAHIAQRRGRGRLRRKLGDKSRAADIHRSDCSITDGDR